MRKLFLLFLLYLCSACGHDAEKRVVTCEGAAKAIGHYSPAIESGGWLFVSGQIGLKTDGSLDSSSFEAECRQTIHNIKTILECTGRSLDNVCKSTVYITSLKNYQALNEVYFSFFKKDVPAREVVEVRALPKNARVEISVVADY